MEQEKDDDGERLSIEMVSVSDISGERGGLLEGLLTTKIRSY